MTLSFVCIARTYNQSERILNAGNGNFADIGEYFVIQIRHHIFKKLKKKFLTFDINGKSGSRSGTFYRFLLLLPQKFAASASTLKS